MPPFEVMYLVAAANATGWPEKKLLTMPLARLLLYVSAYAVSQGAELKYIHSSADGVKKLDNILSSFNYDKFSAK